MMVLLTSVTLSLLNITGQTANMIKLVVCDIDGTLIDRDEILPVDAIKLKKELDEKGVMFSLATGRTEELVEPYRKALGLSVPYVATNGAVVVNGNEYLRRFQIPVKPLKAFMEKADSLGVSIIYTIDGHEYYWRDTSYLSDQRKHFYRSYKERKLSDEEWDKIKIDKLSLITDKIDSSIEELEKDVKKLPEQYGYTRYQDRSIEVVDKRANKFTGLKLLADSLGVKLEEVLFCGDHQNDLELIEGSGVGVAVANGTKEAKAKADYVTEGRCFSGVREAVNKFVLKA